MLGDIGDWSKYLVAAVFVLVGLYLIGVINIPLPGFSGIKQKQRGAWAAFLLGLVFGIALGPCTFAYLAPIIAVAFSASSNDPLFGTLLLLFYGIGHCLVFVIAGTFTRWIQRYLDWTERSKGNVMMKRICGLLVIAGAIYMLTV